MKKRPPEFENAERWLVSYGDMLTLIFAVFVVLYALNLQASKSDARRVAGSMQDSFNTPLDDIPMNRMENGGEDAGKGSQSAVGMGIFNEFTGTSKRKSLRNKAEISTAAVKIVNDEMAKVNLILEERLYGPEKFPSGTGKGVERIVDVSPTRSGFKVQLLARHFFGPNEVDVKRSARKDLDAVVEALKTLGRDVRVEGHTDNDPPAGNLTNWELSTLRATNVVKYMINRLNFPASKVSAAGYADTKPIASNKTESGKSLNRRVEFHVDYDYNDLTEE